MPSKKEMVSKAYEKLGREASAEEIQRWIYENPDYQVQVPLGTIRQVKSKTKAGSKESLQSDDNGDSGFSNSGGDLDSSLSDGERNAGNADRDSVSIDSSGGERPNSVDNLQTIEVEKLDGSILSKIPTETATFHLKEGEQPEESAEMARQYQLRAKGIIDKTDPDKIKSAELEKIELEDERIDAELVADSFVDLTDMGAEKLGEPLNKQEKEKGRKVISRVIKRRLPIFWAYGDIVNLGLWILKVFPRRIFRIKPKEVISLKVPDSEIKEDNSE